MKPIALFATIVCCLFTGISFAHGTGQETKNTVTNRPSKKIVHLHSHNKKNGKHVVSYYRRPAPKRHF